MVNSARFVGGDIAMLRRHRITPEAAPLEIGAHLMSGKDDAVVPSGSAVQWAEFFRGTITRHEIEGGHFFPFRESQGQVLAVIAGVLRDAVARWKWE